MASIDEKQYIIALGASAGGLEAITAFFDHTPLDGVSYIVIQHLSADFKSHMAQILDPHSKLKVVEAENNVTIQANTVYLIPSANFMRIEDGKLKLSEKKDNPTPYLTIDYFFKSLAEERQDKAIGIVLSGTGKDGSKGIEAIKNAGGMVMVQDPETAGFGGMPMAAIATGYADKVISPKAMPSIIEEYVKEGVLNYPIDYKNIDINEDQLMKIIAAIKSNLPLDFTDYKHPTIFRRIKRRMDLHEFTNADAYYDFLINNPEEIELLANDFLVSVTSFFRDAEAFKLIEANVIPAIIDSKNNNEALKLWVAGCATGEEAYSYAMLIKEHLDKTGKELDVKIFATDINKVALNVGSKGIYTDNIKKTVSKERLERFFSAEGKTFKVKHEIRKMLFFAQHDLVKNPPYCNADLISCRNLLIYVNATLQKKVLSMMHFGLKKDGFLVLGPSESIGGLKDDFAEISGKWNILKSTKISKTIKFDAFSSPILDEVQPIKMDFHKIPEAPVFKIEDVDTIKAAILEESGLSGVCTSKELKVSSSFGDPSKYLKNEMFNFNLENLLPYKIVNLIKAAAHKVLISNKKVVLTGLSFQSEGKATRLVDIIIKPLNSKSTENALLILFAENKIKPKQQKESTIKSDEIDQITREHLQNLENELADSKQQLEVAYERIESSNENLQSFNEELLSANEEMQSANEELQSVNEELQTINKEHQTTNVALNELNDDLNNYFRSNVNGQLFVDKELLLKKYSPGAVKHINIRESDIGRPLSNITTNIKFETLIDDIKKVIEEEVTITKEAEASNGKIYQVMTMPYVRKSTNKSDGAIISFHDITELKKLLGELDTSNKSLLRINDDLNNFVFGASHDLSAPIHNIESVIDILSEKIDSGNPDISNLLALINKAINNFKGIIKDLAVVGSIEAEMLEESKLENFEAIFDEIKETVSEKVKLSNATFTTNFQNMEIKFPKKNLRSIMLNLTTNAIKFAHKDRKPEISIKTEKKDKFIVLTVIDNGIGISKNQVEIIFNRYQRMNKDIDGQGIGLYLVKKIVDASGGKVEVESEQGKGSTFRIFFKA